MPTPPHPSATPPPSPEGRSGLGTLLIRADGNERIGAGHIVRALTLVEAWREVGGSAHFLCRADLAPRLRQRIEAAGVKCSLLPPEATVGPEPAMTVQVAEALDAAWIVLDGYDFDPEYQRAVQAGGRQVLVIDDDARWPRYHADLLLNQNLDAEQLEYAGDPTMYRLLGTRYALVGASFRRARELKREIPDRARRILVTLGGADTTNLAPTVLAALGEVPGPLEVRVLVGPANSQAEEGSGEGGAGPHAVEYLVDAPNVAEQFAWADLVVSAAGSTCWELATLGAPAVVIPVADNQRAIAEELAARGVVVNAESAHPLAPLLAAVVDDRARRQEMSERGRALVDGLGASRVVHELCRRTLQLRLATLNDARQVWEWANDAETRRASFRPQSIPWIDHTLWFSSKLIDPGCTLWLAEDGRGRAVGVARYDLAGHEGVLSINIASAQRGAGHGGRLVRLSARRWFLTEPRGTSIRAYVRPENLRAQRLLAKAGFRREEDSTVANQPATAWILERDDL